MSASVATVALQLEKATQFVEEGQMQPAVQLCQQILQEDETCAPAYGLMSDILRGMGNYSSAEKFINLALRFDDTNPAYRIQKAQTLYSLERVEEAIAEMDVLLQRFPNLPVAHLLMGDFLMQQRKFDDALASFNTVRLLADMPGLGEHIGLCYMEMGKLAEAEEQFKDVILRMPEYFRPYQLIGQIYLRNNKISEAEAYLDKALERNPSAYQAWDAKGAIASSKKDEAEALTCFQNALRSNPNHYYPYYVLGTFLQRHKQAMEAQPFLRKAVEIKPNFLPAQVELAMNLYNTGYKQESLAYLDAVLEKQPDNASFRHMRAGIVGESPDNAPSSFVSALFDDYAEIFDQHLLHGLEYTLPEKAYLSLSSTMQEKGDSRTDMSMLDLGCGTGLGAQALQSITGWRVGVDLSSKMVAKAKAKNLYDTLSVGDIVDYTTRSLRSFDLITALDVLVYVGNLAPIFEAAAKKLNEGGYFLISVEAKDEVETFQLNPTGRYGHAARYLEKLAADNNLSQVYKTKSALRMENYAPINGYIYIFRK